MASSSMAADYARQREHSPFPVGATPGSRRPWQIGSAPARHRVDDPPSPTRPTGRVLTREPPVATTALDARPLPRPPFRRQPGYLRRMFADPQPVLDELRAALRPDRRPRVPGRCAWPSSAIPTRAARAVRHSRPTRSAGATSSTCSASSSGDAVDDRVRRRRPQAPPLVRAGGVQPAAAQRLDPDDRRADRRRRRRAQAASLADGPASGRPLPGRAGARARHRRAVAVRRADGRPRATRSAPCFQRPQDYLEAPALRQLPHPFPFTARGPGPGRPPGARPHHRRRDRRAPAPDPTGDPLDVLEVLVADGDLSDAEIRDQVVTLIGAGLRHDGRHRWRGCCGARRSTPGLWARLAGRGRRRLRPVGSALAARRDHARPPRPRRSRDARDDPPPPGGRRLAARGRRRRGGRRPPDPRRGR